MHDKPRFKTSAPQQLHEPGQPFSLRRARRMSRDFADIGGISISATRLRDIAFGAPVALDEYIEIAFAITAVEIRQSQCQEWPHWHRRAVAQGITAVGQTLAFLTAISGVLGVFLLIAEYGL